MWKKNKGFFLPEMLLTLTAWLLIASIFFPLIMNLVNHSIRLQQDYEGTKVLYEALLQAKKEDRAPFSELIALNRTVYEISQEASGNRNGVEVCVKYVDVFKNDQQKCEKYEQ
ncbi:type II secretion system protein [Cytobacillus depressus]|uniref:Type II secretion system protein n=1 Tax=Cytobacillus depressus TaxID=1602942 RepID=A0A6L3V9Y8_9BACI|nr:type II secretion system protein [Cytobacillus depressus]KAB2338501.1 type II secretion system protein [Cytobacillus depressus]